MAFPTGWTRYCPLVVQHGQVPADQTAFPVLITQSCLPGEMITAGGTHAAQSDGGDIRFTSDSAGTAQLPCEVVVFVQNTVPANALVEIWVKADILTAANVTIYVWYSAGGGQTQPAAGSTFGSQNVWTAAYYRVWHLAEASNALAVDSVVQAGSFVNLSTQVPGKFGMAQSFNGTTEYIHLLTVGGLSAPYTISAWTKVPSATLPSNIYDSRSSGFGIAVGTSMTTGEGIYYSNPPSRFVRGPVTAADNNWHYIVATQNGTAAKLYQDAAAPGTDTFTNAVWGTGYIAYDGGTQFPATTQELRFSSTARDANWILTEYHNQNSPGTFIIAGTPVAIGGGGGTSTISATCSILINPGAYGSPTGIWLDLWVWRQLWHLDALTDTVSFLPVYRRALVMGLARELCREYGRDPAVVEGQANQAMAELENSNQSIRTEGVKDLEQS